MNAFGKILVELREKAGLSQNRLAQMINTNPTHLSKIERGKRTPPLKLTTLIEMARALNLDSGEIKRFLHSALHSQTLTKPLYYSSPFEEDDLISFLDDEIKQTIMKAPVIKLIIETLIDPKISAKQKNDFEDKAVFFIKWLQNYIKAKK